MGIYKGMKKDCIKIQEEKKNGKNGAKRRREREREEGEELSLLGREIVEIADERESGEVRG